MNLHSSARYFSAPDGHAWKVIDRRSGRVLIFADETQRGLFETEAVALASGLNDLADTAVRCRLRRLAKTAGSALGRRVNDPMPARPPVPAATGAAPPPDPADPLH